MTCSLLEKSLIFSKKTIFSFLLELTAQTKHIVASAI